MDRGSLCFSLLCSTIYSLEYKEKEKRRSHPRPAFKLFHYYLNLKLLYFFLRSIILAWCTSYTESLGWLCHCRRFWLAPTCVRAYPLSVSVIACLPFQFFPLLIFGPWPPAFSSADSRLIILLQSSSSESSEWTNEPTKGCALVLRIELKLKSFLPFLLLLKNYFFFCFVFNFISTGPELFAGGWHALHPEERLASCLKGFSFFFFFFFLNWCSLCLIALTLSILPSTPLHSTENEGVCANVELQ